MRRGMNTGKNTSEYKLTRNLLIVGIILAVGSSLGKTPWTPDQVWEYIRIVVAEASEWSKTLMPYATILVGWYTANRTYRKNKS